MRISAVDRISPAAAPIVLPLSLVQTPSRRSALVLLLLFLPVATVLLAPFALLATGLVEDPSLRETLAGRPASLFQILCGLGFWAVLLGWPIKRLFDGLTKSRKVLIDNGVIDVTDTGIWGTRDWQAPLGAFAGIAHHVRASRSGVRHELILVHPDRRQSVLLAMADRMNQSEVDHAVDILGLPEIPAVSVYRTRLASSPGFDARSKVHPGS